MRLAAVTLLSVLSGSQAAQAPSPTVVRPTVPPAGTGVGPFAPRCTSGSPASLVGLTATPLPAVVSGRVAFNAVIATPGLAVQRSVTLGDVDTLFPLASSYKPLVVRGILRDVDAGRLKLNTKLTTTEANRSIEGYPKGANEVRELARRAIYLSDNTASDILHLAYGPDRLAREVRAKWPCTTVLNTTKTWWAAQAGMLSTVVGPDTLGGLRTLAAAPFEDRVRRAGQLIAASQRVSAPALEKVLDDYFHGPSYTPELEFYAQPTSTAREFTNLALQVYSGADLKPATRDVYRAVMQTGCCRPKAPRLKTKYWAAKAGSGWRILTLSGMVELPDGRVMAYTYLNDQSTVTDAEEMEKQIRPVVTWIESQLITLAGGTP